MRLIFDATALQLYPLAKPGFRGGTEVYVEKVTAGLAALGHTVHVVANDADVEEQRSERLWYWPTAYHPTHADAVVAVHSLEYVSPDSAYDAPFLIGMGNGLGAFLGPDDEWAKWVDAWPVFSECHRDLLVKHHPNVDPAKCYVTGLGIEVGEYRHPHDNHNGYPCPICEQDFCQSGCTDAQKLATFKVPGRMFFSNDPARGLWHVLDVFDAVKKRVPHATLHVGYDFQRNFERAKWGSNALAEMFWECRDRLANTPGVVDLGQLSREDLIREQLECQVCVMPSDPPNVGSQIHGIGQMEAAAAGAALVLSDTEAFPEVFGGAATILPLPGTYLPNLERRYDAQDWAEAVVQLMEDPEKWGEASRAARALAERHTWDAVVGKWQEMLVAIEAGVKPAEAVA